MVNNEYVYIAPCFISRRIQSWKPWENMNDNETDKKLLAKTVFANTIVVRLFCHITKLQKVTQISFQIQNTGEEITILNKYKNYLESILSSGSEPFALTSDVQYYKIPNILVYYSRIF